MSEASPMSSMAPSFEEFLTTFPGRHRGKSVAFVEAVPEIQVISSELSSWQEGEHAESPSDFEIQNADMLTEKALAAAAAEEERDLKQKALTPPPVHALPKRAPAIRRTTAPAHIQRVEETPVTANRSQLIRRKPVPVRAQTLQVESTVVDRRAAERSSARPTFARASTTFDDFLPPQKINTWPGVEHEEKQRRHAYALPSLAKHSFKKARYQVMKKVALHLRE